MKSAVETLIKDPGFNSEEAQQRKKYMVDLFVTQAKNYDFHDDVYGLYAHRIWVLSLLKVIKRFMKGRTEAKLLDLACGTGFITFNVAGRHKNIAIDGFDISPHMIAVAEARRQKGFKDRDIKFWVSDAEVAYGENKYDIVTTSFAFRNFVNKNLAADNVFKALKPGGVFIIQDLTKPEYQPIKGLYLFSMKYLLPILAKILGIEKRASRYLYNSVLTMPKNAEIKALLKSRSFERVSYKSMSFSIACIITGYKPKE